MHLRTGPSNKALMVIILDFKNRNWIAIYHLSKNFIDSGTLFWNDAIRQSISMQLQRYGSKV
jgi:hypothetical protein